MQSLFDERRMLPVDATHAYIANSISDMLSSEDTAFTQIEASHARWLELASTGERAAFRLRAFWHLINFDLSLAHLVISSGSFFPQIVVPSRIGVSLGSVHHRAEDLNRSYKRSVLISDNTGEVQVGLRSSSVMQFNGETRISNEDLISSAWQASVVLWNIRKQEQTHRYLELMDHPPEQSETREKEAPQRRGQLSPGY